MKRHWFLLVIGAATCAAAPVREAACSLTIYRIIEHPVEDYLELLSDAQTSGSSGCSIGTPTGPFAVAQNTLKVEPTSLGTFIWADANADLGTFGLGQDYFVTGRAASFIEYEFIAYTPGPVRPGLLYVEGSAGLGRGDHDPEKPQPFVSITFGDVVVVQGLHGNCIPDIDTCSYPSWPPRPTAAFRLGTTFPVRIRVGADTGTNGDPGAFAGAFLDVRFAEPGPCPDHFCDIYVGGFQVVPEPSSGLLVLLPIAVALAMRICRNSRLQCGCSKMGRSTTT